MPFGRPLFPFCGHARYRRRLPRRARYRAIVPPRAGDSPTRDPSEAAKSCSLSLALSFILRQKMGIASALIQCWEQGISQRDHPQKQIPCKISAMAGLCICGNRMTFTRESPSKAGKPNWLVVSNRIPKAISPSGPSRYYNGEPMTGFRSSERNSSDRCSRPERSLRAKESPR